MEFHRTLQNQIYLPVLLKVSFFEFLVTVHFLICHWKKDSLNASVSLVVQCGTCLPLNNKWILGGRSSDKAFWDVWFCPHAAISLLAWKVYFALKESPTSSPWRYLRQWQRGIPQHMDSFYREVPGCARTQVWHHMAGLILHLWGDFSSSVVAWFTVFIPAFF